MGALDHAVKSGKALYAGISNYSAEQTRAAAEILRGMGTHCLIHQPRYSMFDRWIESELLGALREYGIGCIAFSPLEQGLLTDRYLRGIPHDSRAAKPNTFLQREHVTEAKLAQVRQLNDVAQARGQTLAQMAVAWVLRHPGMTSAVIGASRVSQIEDAVKAVEQLKFDTDELARIQEVLLVK
jgi:L-glyceraldehyde 3-phosphate reductase